MPTMPRLLKSPWTWAVTGLAVALYAAAGFLLVPRLVAGGVRDFFDSRYHRKVELGRVAFNPFTLELTVEHLAVPDADGSLLAGFDRLYVHLKFRSLVLGGADFKAVALDGPRAHLVRRPDGRINLMDLVAGAAATPAQPASTPPRLWIHELSIRGGEATFVDRSGRTDLDVALKPITFTLTDFNTRSENNAYALSARSALGETLDWKGTFGLDPVLESKGEFAIGHLTAHTISDVGPRVLPVDLAQGAIDLHGSYAMAEQGKQLALTVTVAELVGSDLALRAPGEQDAWVTIPRVAVTGTTLDLAKASVVVEHVLIERPAVRAWRDRGGTINLARLVRANPAQTTAAPSAAQTTAAPAAAPAAGPPWTVRVPDIRVAAGDVAFEDRVPRRRPASVHVAPLEVTVAGFSLPAGAPLAVALDAGVNGDGRIAAKGTVALAPLAANLAVEARALGLTALQPYLDSATAMTIKAGVAGLKGTVKVDAGGGAQFQGDASVDGFHSVDNALEEDFVNWRSLQLSGVSLQSSPLALRIREVTAREPYARVIVGSNGRTNLSLVLRPNAPPPETPAQGEDAQPPTAPPAEVAAAVPVEPAVPAAKKSRATAPATPIDIGVVRLARGSTYFEDYSVKPNVKTGIYDLEGSIRGLSSKPDSRADVKIDGKIDRYAPVTVTGKVNLLAAVAYTNVALTFKNVDLSVLSPYSGKFAGYRIDKGKLSVDFKYLIENRKLTASHKIIVNQLQLGERVDSPDATHLPIKLAIALLKDRNGIIDLDLPVSGSLDDPKFRLGPIIWKVVVNLIEKAVTAPFALLGRLFGGGEEISYLDFPAGSATLDAAARGKVAALVKALDSRPGLNVDLPLVAAPAADGGALAEQKWHGELATRAARRLGPHAADPGALDRLLATPKDYRAVLEDSYAAAFGHRAQIPPPPEPAKGAPPPDATALAVAWLEQQLKPRFGADAAEIDALAQSRADAVQSALLDGTGIDPTRVFVVRAAPLPATGGPVRMQLALH